MAQQAQRQGGSTCPTSSRLQSFHVLHNPWASIPIADGTFSGFTEHRLWDDGLVLTTSDRIDYFTSHTLVLHAPDARTRARGYAERYQATAASSD